MRQPSFRPWPRVTLLVAALALAGVACTRSADVNTSNPATSASSSSSSSSVALSTTTTAFASPDPTNEPRPSTTAGPPSTTPEVKAFCAKSTEVDRETSAGDPQAPDFLAKQKIAYQQLTDIAPGQIKTDMQALNAVVQKANTIADTSALSTDPLLGAALDRVTKFVSANCN